MKTTIKASRDGAQATTKVTKGELIAKRIAAASCGRCVYLRGAAEAGYAGECHRNAPGAGLIRFATESVGVSPASWAAWPLVKATDSCGEFIKRPTVK
jgi:hypothetical protein